MMLRLRRGRGLLWPILRLLPCVILDPWLQTRILYPGNIRRISCFIAFTSFLEIQKVTILASLLSILQTVLIMSLKNPRKHRFDQMEFFTRYNPPPKVGEKNSLASLTRQEFAQETDINNIMAKYAAGMAPIPSGNRPPQFGDFSDGLDYQACLDKLIAAQSAFDSLPSKVRDRFGNDPARLLDFLSDESNRAEAITLGLIDPPASAPANESSKKDDVDNSSVPPKGGAAE